jgi:hypothetical protein
MHSTMTSIRKIHMCHNDTSILTEENEQKKMYTSYHLKIIDSILDIHTYS